MTIATEAPPLPLYKSHKQVRAFKIETIGDLYMGEVTLSGQGHSATVPLAFFGKHGPLVGGYYVRYADGYESYSPAEAFEEGYAPIPELGCNTANRGPMRLLRNKPIGLHGPVDVYAIDGQGPGGANHEYLIIVNKRRRPGEASSEDTIKTRISFQNGPILEGGGVNGLQNEDLLAILVDRMVGFQSGPFACEDNAAALAALETARDALWKRTVDRYRRGVEGTHQQ